MIHLELQIHDLFTPTP